MKKIILTIIMFLIPISNAYANTNDSKGFAAFVPLLIIGGILASIVTRIAKRKGKNQYLWLVIALIPGYNFFAALWLVSLTDIEIVEKIGALTNALNEMKKGNP